MPSRSLCVRLFVISLTMAQAANGQDPATIEKITSTVNAVVTSSAVREFCICELQPAVWGSLDAQALVDKTVASDGANHRFRIAGGQFFDETTSDRPSGLAEAKRSGFVTFSTADAAFQRGVPFFISQPVLSNGNATLNYKLISNPAFHLSSVYARYQDLTSFGFNVEVIGSNQPLSSSPNPQNLTWKFNSAIDAPSNAGDKQYFSMVTYGAVNGSNLRCLQSNEVDLVALTGPPPPPPLSVVSAASFAGDSVAPDSIAAAFGQNLAAGVQTPAGGEFPTTLGGVSIRTTDSAGADRLAQIYFISPSEINFVMPAGMAAGTAKIAAVRDGQTVASGSVRIDPVAPSLFTANASGKGPAAAVWLRVAADGTQTSGLTFQCPSAVNCVNAPVDLGAATDQVFLLLFGTGIRGHGSAAGAVTATIGDQTAEVLAATAQGQYPGFDQVNLRIPRQLAGRGDVNVVLMVDGKPANTVTVAIGGAPPAGGSDYLPLKTGMTWDYRVTFTETVQLPYDPIVEAPAGLLCASVFCGTKQYPAGEVNFRMTVNESLGTINGGESFRLTVTDPGHDFYFARNDPMEMRVRPASGVPRLEVIDTPSGFRLVRPLAQPTTAELAQNTTLAVPAGSYNNVVKTTLTLNGDGVYVKGTYTTDVYLAPGVGLIKAVMRDGTGKTLFTQELTAVNSN